MLLTGEFINCCELSTQPMLLAAAVKMIIELISMSIDTFNQKLILNYTNNVTENLYHDSHRRVLWS